ncbi:type II CAAX endopeptidase family protein [Amnibacterium sp. CER49]|uniref:CPBP family intramembrane glutamic endopeptidase n=1 Tax=Amnibacterium sp. CER49 TaxID=3039161 RepID=UPI00244A2FFA|nr:type II CAAX endopeptidase family protein [Amnibacterium sp. CER49]MDH2445352.1 type II CAAX endopeptidase family protein [Amnibacterium sp. CER49]
MSAEPGLEAPVRPARPGREVLLVLGLSLGASAVYAAVSLADSLSRGPLKGQTTTLNPSQSDRPVFDLIYQLLGLATDLVPVLLALYLLGAGALRRIGLDARRPRFDLVAGVVLALCIGLPGLGLYFGAVALGLNLQVATSGIGPQWYAIPVLVLSALRAAVQEEVIVVGYLFTRLDELRWRPWLVVAASALLRGSYHLYQGFGGFVGNAVMGVVFGLVYRRFGRVAPLVVAHFLLDFVSFVGYDLLKALAPGLLP